MITTVTTTRQGRKNWRTGEQPVIEETWTQIEGTITKIDEVDGQLVHHIDTGDQTTTLIISGRNAHTSDNRERGLPQPGEQVRILANEHPAGSPSAAMATYRANDHRVTVLPAEEQDR